MSDSLKLKFPGFELCKSGNTLLKELFTEVVQELSCYCQNSLLPTC